jgi:homoserine O-acetyltransferase/O-succinyltransferase
MEPVPAIFDLTLPSMTLEAGTRLDRHEVRGWWWGSEPDLAWLKACSRVLPSDQVAGVGTVVRRGDEPVAPTPRPEALGQVDPPEVETVVVVHALTGDMRAGGPGGWWEPLVGPGRPLDPTRHRILCFNNLGSCYGTTGPADADFPRRQHDPRLPATLTTWDQARSILLALDALGIRRVQLLTGGSIGAMIVLCLAALDPHRFERVLPIAGAEAASAWVIGWSQVGRQAILSDPGFPDHATRGLELARQIAQLTYRAEAGLQLRQGRGHAPALEGSGADHKSCSWSPTAPYRVQTYLEHHGQKLVARFDPRAYLAQMDAMDHHDLARVPPPPDPGETWSVAEAARPAPVGPVTGDGLALSPADPSDSWGLRRIRAQVLAVSIDSDQLFFPAHMVALCERLRRLGLKAQHVQLCSPHGHDSFLIEWDQVAAALERAWSMAPRQRALRGKETADG